MSGALLEASGLYKSYGKVSVLKNVDLSVAEGERHVVIGPNGAGKTTLFKVLSGELPVDRGRIRYAGEDITASKGYRRAHMGFGRTFQVARVFPAMTVLTNLVVALEAAPHSAKGLTLSGRPKASIHEEAEALLAQLGLERYANEAASLLSHGDKKRLELAQVLSLKPKILFLDEPTAGMSPADRQAAVALIDQLVTSHNITLILTEHDMGVVFDLGTRLTVLHYGEVVVSGAPEAVRNDPMVRDIYLGQSSGHA